MGRSWGQDTVALAVCPLRTILWLSEFKIEHRQQNITSRDPDKSQPTPDLEEET